MITLTEIVEENIITEDSQGRDSVEAKKTARSLVINPESISRIFSLSSERCAIVFNDGRQGVFLGSLDTLSEKLGIKKKEILKG